MLPADLPATLRAKAADLRDLALESVALAYEDAARMIEEALDSAQNEALTLQAAAEESGYSSDHLGRLVREGKIPNAGRPNAPRIKRGDLPIKPKPRTPAVAQIPKSRHRSNRQVVQSIIEGAS